MASSKFMLPLWLNFSIVICLIYVRYVLGKGPVLLDKLGKERQRAGKGSFLDLAWRSNQIRDALTELGFNHTRCKERHWKKYVRLPDRSNGTFRRTIRRLCQRLNLPNDADRLERHRRYLAQVGRKYKLDELIKLLLGKLSGNNETREQFLDDKKFVIDKSTTDCYWKTYYVFAETCTDPHFGDVTPYLKWVHHHDWRTLGMRHIWANACSAPWLDSEKIKQCLTEVCSDFDLYI